MGFFGLDIKSMEKNKDVDGLIKCLKDRDGNVRHKAGKALGNLGDKRSVQPLIESLNDNDFNGDPDSKIAAKGMAIDALGIIGDSRAVQPIIDFLKEKTPGVSPEMKRSVTYVTIKALGNLRDSRAVDPLIEIVRNSSGDECKWAIDALEKIGTFESESALIDIAHNPKYRQCWSNSPNEFIKKISDDTRFSPLIANARKKYPIKTSTSSGEINGSVKPTRIKPYYLILIIGAILGIIITYNSGGNILVNIIVGIVLIFILYLCIENLISINKSNWDYDEVKENEKQERK